jgi:hypothetical protein
MDKDISCPICYDKLSKIHLVLPCGHRFHFKCMELCKPQICPYCRQLYEKPISARLRSRTHLVNKLKEYMFNITLLDTREHKVKIMLEIFKLINNNFNIIKYFGVRFLDILQNKIKELKLELIYECISKELKNKMFEEMEITRKTIEYYI